MIINHNMSAMNAHRQMSINNSTLAKSLEKLSSGLAINRASDNAAGLAISEKMRGQISGLDQATKNSQDGISLIQTAEGALNETHSILQRMRELAVQSANGTYQDDVDRENIQKEVTALKTEIDRIATSTHYNNIKLLDGSLQNGTKSGVAKIDLPVAIDNTTTLTNVVDATKGSYVSTAAISDDSSMTTGDVTSLTINYEDAQGNVGSVKIDLTYKNATTLVDKNGNEYTVTSGAATAAEKQPAFLAALKNSELANDFDITASSGKFTFSNKEAGTSTMKITSMSTSNVKAGVASAHTDLGVTPTAPTDAYQTLDFTQFDSTDESKNSFSINGQEFKIVASTAELANLSKDVIGLVVASAGAPAIADVTSWIGQIKQATGLEIKDQSTADGTVNIYGKVGSSLGDGGLTFQIGANGSKDQRVSLSVGNMSSVGIGVKQVDVSTQEGANKAIAKIDAAINTVSGTRADLGALQNRLEHTINSLGVASENLTAAESRIRDVDMAKEMMSFTKTQILSQAAQAMLAQANTLPQGVLQLLR
jgi:flagellin